MLQNDAKRRIVISFLVGGALVAVTIAVNIYMSPSVPSINEQIALTIAASPRDFITVTDSNSDGIEDWREEFITETSLDIPTVTNATFTMPTTLTDRVGIQLFQSSIRDKSLGGYGRGNEVIVGELTKDLAEVVEDKLYTRRDIVVTQTNPATIKTYGNTMGQSLIVNNVIDSEWELTIVNRALDTNNASELEKLTPLAEMYRKLRDDALNTPVPDRHAENHINLINTYNALYHSITDLKLIFTDPMVALLRIKRYEDDAKGLAVALHNIYLSAIPYESIFTKDDPAMVFVTFANIE